MRYEHPPIASLLIGVAQEADPVSPGFEQSTAISNHSTLDFTLHYGEQRIVLPGDASWKRLCSSSVPPDDDLCPKMTVNPHNVSYRETQQHHNIVTCITLYAGSRYSLKSVTSLRVNLITRAKRGWMHNLDRGSYNNVTTKLTVQPTSCQTDIHPLVTWYLASEHSLSVSMFISVSVWYCTGSETTHTQYHGW